MDLKKVELTFTFPFFNIQATTNLKVHKDNKITAHKILFR